tara:strand:- start:60 stop:464 length:405 start_codon:yes stop_codon:yes gene_type:complete
MGKLKFVYKKDELPTNRNFGIVFFIFFSLITIYPLIKFGEFKYSFLILSLIFLILGLINSKILTPLNIFWTNLGIVLGIIVAPLVMGVVYFFVVTPISLILKLLKKDVLNIKINDNKSYWINKSKIKSKMKNQF